MKKRKTLHLVSQAHLDPVWLWPLTDGIAECLTTMQSAVDRAGEFPSFTFTRSSTCTYQWVKDMDPRLYRHIKSLIEEGRWEVVGGWIEQPDCNLPSGESFFRQALYGKRFLRDEFGPKGDTRIGYNVDSFGHAGGLPQILKKTGFDYYAFMRPEPWANDRIPLLFWWQSDDGSKVLCQRIPGCYSQSYSATGDDIEKLIREASETHFAPGFSNGVMWFGVGNHGGGPTKEQIERVILLQDDPFLPEIRFSTLQHYFNEVEKESGMKHLPTVGDDLQFVFRGCYSATGEVKHLNRKGEKTLLHAEALGTITSLGTKENFSAAELHDAWQKLLFNQFHDILAGTCVASSQEETRWRYGAALDTGREVCHRMNARLARSVDTSGERGSVLFVANPLPWERETIVELDTFQQPHGREEITHLETRDGQKIPIQWQKSDANFGPWGLKWGKLTACVPLPAGGYRVFRVCTKRLENRPKDLSSIEERADETNMQFTGTGDGEQTNTKKLSLDEAFSYLSDKSGANFLQRAPAPVIIDDQSGTWGHGVESYDQELGVAQLVSCEMIEDGNLLQITRQKYLWEQSEIWLDFVRFHHTCAVEIRVRFNWQQKRQLLKLELPLTGDVELVTGKMPASVASRQANGQEMPCHDWIACSLKQKKGTVAVLTSSTYAYDAKDNRLRLTLARGVPHAEHPPFEYKDTSNVAFLDQGWQERKFLLTASRQNWETLNLDTEAETWQCRPFYFLDSAHSGCLPWENSFFRLDSSTVSLLCLKPAEDGNGWILRLQENVGESTKCNMHWAEGQNSFLLEFKPWQIQTWRIIHCDGKYSFQSCDGLEI